MITNLETPEDGLALENREAPRKKRRLSTRPIKVIMGDSGELRPTAEEELAALKARIRAARELTPQQLHRVHNCRTCFNAARDATIRAIEEP